jgi:hypothetical protein
VTGGEGQGSYHGEFLAGHGDVSPLVAAVAADALADQLVRHPRDRLHLHHTGILISISSSGIRGIQSSSVIMISSSSSSPSSAAVSSSSAAAAAASS